MEHQLRLQGLRVTDFLLKVTIPMYAMQCVRFLLQPFSWYKC